MISRIRIAYMLQCSTSYLQERLLSLRRPEGQQSIRLNLRIPLEGLYKLPYYRLGLGGLLPRPFPDGLPVVDGALTGRVVLDMVLHLLSIDY